MFYCNNGTLDVKKEYIEEVIDAFSNTSLKNKISAGNVEEATPGIATFFLEEIYGDIEDDLRLAMRQLEEKGIIVNGKIDYFGDYDGRYIIHDSAVAMENPDYCEETLHAASDEVLFYEVARRGMNLLAGGKTYLLAEIGTVEEFRAAMKETAKKVVEKHKATAPEDIEAYGENAVFGYCPVCGHLQSDVWNTKRCGDCGQKLDWSDKKMNEELKPCPFCGNKIDQEKDMYLPERDWEPTFCDPDSGGDPINIHCKCGLEFSTGTYDYAEFLEAWNRRINDETD